MDVKKHLTLNDFAVLSLTLCLMASFMGTIFSVPRITSLAFALSMVAVVCLFGYRCFKNQKINSYLAGMMLLMVLSLLFGDFGGGFDYFKPAIILLCAFACIALSYDVEISEDCKKLVILAVMVGSVTVVIYFHFFGLNKDFYGSTDLALLKFQNPNEAGLWVTFFIMIVSAGIRVFSTVVMKIVSAFVAIQLIPLLMAVKSRNAIIACAFFLVGYAILWIFKMKKVPKWVILTVTLSPLIVFSAYMLIHYANPDMLKVVVGDDPSKTMSSRAEVWSRVVESFKDSFLFGDYGEFADQQMHNSFATVFCQYGILFVAVATSFMYNAACRLQKKRSVYSALALCSIYVSGCFETSLFGGVSGLYLMFFLLPVCFGAGKRKEALNVSEK